MITTIDLTKGLSAEAHKSIMHTGFCYVKIPPEHALALEKITTTAHDYFKQDETVKSQYKLDDNLEGYLDQRANGGENIERFAYRGHCLPSPLDTVADEMRCIKDYFSKSIGLPIIQSIFRYMNIMPHYEKTVKDHSSSVSLIHYPYPNTQKKSGLVPHQDLDLITLLYINQEGLSVRVDDTWHEINYRPGTIIANVGNVLKLMTGNQFASAWHKVNITPNTSRYSIACFLGPNPNMPLCDYINDTEHYPDYKTMFEEHVKFTYPDINL
jgi:isopenicillin N synthase-like dioxygenase